MRRKILFVALPDSVHSARWISQLDRRAWEVHLFPAYPAEPHPGLKGVTLHDSFGPAIRRKMRTALHMARGRRPDHAASELARVIRRVRPHIVHSMEMPRAGWLAARAFDLLGGGTPPWVVSCWGSDLVLFGRLKEHEPRLRRILGRCDYFLSDSERDVELARRLGFGKQALPALPGGGGYDVEAALRAGGSVPPSGRKLVVLKGYQGVMGRALSGVAALRLCERTLLREGYKVALYSGHTEDVRVAAELLAESTGIPVEVLPRSPHERMLRLFGEARAAVGLSISDGMPNVLLEAMLMGAFPIQSDTFGQPDWFQDGRNGLLVPPEDPGRTAAALERSLSDDGLVDEAARANREIIAGRYGSSEIREKVRRMYDGIAAAGS